VLKLFPIVLRCLLNDAVWFACRFAFVSCVEGIWYRGCWSYLVSGTLYQRLKLFPVGARCFNLKHFL
jgi:hypothetical protein